MCVQYPSEEEYIRVMLVREQEKMKQKLENDRQRYMDNRKQITSSDFSSDGIFKFTEKNEQVLSSSVPCSASVSSSSLASSCHSGRLNRSEIEEQSPERGNSTTEIKDLKPQNTPQEVSTQVSSNKPESSEDDLENQILNHV